MEVLTGRVVVLVDTNGIVVVELTTLVCVEAIVVEVVVNRSVAVDAVLVEVTVARDVAMVLFIAVTVTLTVLAGGVTVTVSLAAHSASP